MTPFDTALQAIYDGIDAANEQVDPAARLVKSPDTVLVGPGGTLDSLGLVTLLVAVETHLQRAVGRRIPLATNDQLYAEDSPLASASRFATFLAQRLEAPR